MIPGAATAYFELGEIWRDVHELLLHVTVQNDERQQIEAILARIEALRERIREADATSGSLRP
jgi:hypothetical protein